MVLSSRLFGAGSSALPEPARIVAPRTRRQIAAAAAGVRAAGGGAATAFLHPAARAVLAEGGAHGVEAAGLLAREPLEPQAFDGCLWRWALADPAALARTLARATALEQALSPAFARFLDDMLGATPSEAYESLRRAVRRLQAFPEDARARAAVLTQVESFAFAMMTGPVALRSAVEWSLRGVADALVAARPLEDAACLSRSCGFHDLDAPAAYVWAASAEDGPTASLAAPAVAEWLVQPAPSRESPPRRALVAALARTASSAHLRAALEAAAARRALAEAPDARDLSAAMHDVCAVLGRPFVTRAASLSEPDHALLVAVLAALASHPLDGRALRTGRADRCDMTIRFDATASRIANAARARPLRAVFGALYESGVASALAEIASAHACLRGRIADEAPADRVAAGAHLIDMAGFVPRALRAGLALRRLCEADDGALIHAWRPPAVHAQFLEHAFATA